MVYKKTRTGCTQCRSRKVKCDECQPCGACRRRQEDCSLTNVRPTDLLTMRQRGTSQKMHQAATKALPQNALRLGTIPIAPAPPGATNPVEAELIAHWISASFQSVPHGEIDRRLWQYEVPMLAQEHPVVMNLTLGISSYHRAYKAYAANDDRIINRQQYDTYFARGLNHQKAAIASMTAFVAENGSHNGRACLVAASLLVICSYAEGLLTELSRRRDESSSMLDDLLVIYRLTRGIRTIRDTFEVNMRPNGGERVLDVTDKEPPENGALGDLLLCIRSANFLDAEENPVTREICQTAMDLLYTLVRKAQNSDWMPSQRASLQWICFVSEDFMNLLQARQPAALVVLSYACFVADYVPSGCFVFSGWKRGVNDCIHQTLNSKWRGFLIL